MLNQKRKSIKMAITSFVAIVAAATTIVGCDEDGCDPTGPGSFSEPITITIVGKMIGAGLPTDRSFALDVDADIVGADNLVHQVHFDGSVDPQLRYLGRANISKDFETWECKVNKTGMDTKLFESLYSATSRLTRLEASFTSILGQKVYASAKSITISRVTNGNVLINTEFDFDHPRSNGPIDINFSFAALKDLSSK